MPEARTAVMASNSLKSGDAISCKYRNIQVLKVCRISLKHILSVCKFGEGLQLKIFTFTQDKRKQNKLAGVSDSDTDVLFRFYE